MGALIGPAIRAALAWILQGKIFGTIGDLGLGLLNLGQWFEWLAEVVDYVFGGANGGERYSERWGTRSGQQIEQMGQDIKDLVHHTYEVVIPHSLAFLAGYIVSKYIVPIERRLDNFSTRIGILEGFRRSTDHWRFKYVDPNIKDWIAWHKWFDGWPRGILFLWHDWLAHPSKFADWATPPLIRPIIEYLAARNHKNPRDDLTQVIVDATPDVWRHAEAATLAILQKDYP